MANSKYEYVKSFEVEDEVMPPNLIIVRVDGRDFRRFFFLISEVHEFEEPNDEKALNLMNHCATIIMDEDPDIVVSYGFSDEYRKLLPLVASFFTSLYVTNWKKLFPLTDLRYPPLFHARIVICASLEVLQAYLAWRQKECHINNLNDTCFWELGKCGKTEREVQDILKDNPKKEKHELLFQESSISTTKNSMQYFNKDPAFSRLRVKPDYFWSFQVENKLMPSTWAVIRIDGCHFHRFSEVHEFEKPNDERALNSCAVAVIEEFPDIVFSYGDSDKYSLVLKKDSQLYQGQASAIVSVIGSFFSSMYVMKWKEFLPQKELKYPPSFDSRAVCYLTREILLDHLAWRLVDCHINNQYNTCSWELVESGKTKSKAQDYLKLLILQGTQAQEKEDLLSQKFNICKT